MSLEIRSFPPGGLALVLGASGGIGLAIHQVLEQSGSFDQVMGLSRSTDGFDVTDEDAIATAASEVAATGRTIRLIIVATGLLHDGTMQPEKTWRQLDAGTMARSFAVNAIGPALVGKHFLPLLPRQGKAVFAALSAKVGSIGDNHLGGWYAYRAAKAALNQLMHTAAIELRRTRPDAICVTLHPGTVATPLSGPFGGSGHEPVEPAAAAHRLLGVIDQLRPIQSGQLLDHTGLPLPW